MAVRGKTNMTGQFKRIGLFSKPVGDDIAETLNHVANFLQRRKHQICIDETSATLLTTPGVSIVPSAKFAQQCDLAIVIGGDGSMLKAARAITDAKIPIIGINRGKLGFLADVNPNQLEETLSAILDGQYQEEQRMMLQATIIKNQKIVSKHLALNDVVLHHGDIARLIEFEVFVDDQFVIDQRSDGLITASPTGSTAYALSGGGPIVYPTLDVITLVPMFAHTLSARPIVINKNSKIKLLISPLNKIYANLSCDGQTHMTLNAGDEVHIQAHTNSLRLLHPKNYSYFNVLREKLGWNLKFNK